MISTLKFSNSSSCNCRSFGFLTLSTTSFLITTRVVLQTETCLRKNLNIQAKSILSEFSRAFTRSKHNSVIQFKKIVGSTRSRKGLHVSIRTRVFAAYRPSSAVHISTLRFVFRHCVSRAESCVFFEYNFKIEYNLGKDNVIADVISRLLYATAQEGTQIKDHRMKVF